MSRQAVAVLLIVVAAVAVGAWLLGGGRAPGADPAAEATLPPVAPSPSIVADARAVPLQRVELAAPVGATTVADVWVSEGGSVAAGAPLVGFDPELAKADVASAEAALDAAVANETRTAAAADQADAQVEVAAAAIEEAKSALAAADARRDATPSGTTARRAANADVARAQDALDGARAQRDVARSASDGAMAASDAATAEVAQARAALAAAQTALGKLTVVAPFAGVVASLDARVGETVPPGTVVVRIADPSGWRFETTDLDETSVGRITEGAAATISLDAFPDAVIEGRVASIAPFGTSSTGDIVYTVVIEPTSAVPDGLRWNMTASVTIDATPAQ